MGEPRYYPDGTEICPKLPPEYQLSGIPGTTPGSQMCGNCGYFDSGQCRRWFAPVRPEYWCLAWKPSILG
jgi:hypothetical protein